MTKFRLLAAAVILSAASATPVFAQAAIQEPGAYAFYHPNADLSLGYPAAGAVAPVPLGSSMAQMRSTTMSHPLPVRHVRTVRRY